jgi:hypothetical protein
MFTCDWIFPWILRLIVDFLWLKICLIYFVIIFHVRWRFVSFVMSKVCLMVCPMSSAQKPNSKDLSLDIKVNCWSSMIGSLSNPFCYHSSFDWGHNVQVNCLFNHVEGFCGLSNVKCTKGQFWGNRLLQMWVGSRR